MYLGGFHRILLPSDCLASPYSRDNGTCHEVRCQAALPATFLRNMILEITAPRICLAAWLTVFPEFPNPDRQDVSVSDSRRRVCPKLHTKLMRGGENYIVGS
jgi:hypothetical protein